MFGLQAADLKAVLHPLKNPHSDDIWRCLVIPNLRTNRFSSRVTHNVHSAWGYLFFFSLPPPPQKDRLINDDT